MLYEVITGVLDFDTDPYADLHALEAESYHGQLVTNIFGGETVNTERAFLTRNNFV